MEALQASVDLLSLDEKWLQEFDVVDPFNGNRLQGYLSMKPDHRYGALVISHVNEAFAPQLIYATPKLHYPFGKTGEFSFPPVHSILIYEKLDGTNVLAYSYKDGAGHRFLTFKLRLYPVLRNGKWGAFLDLWKEMLQEFPNISELPTANGCSISFELYGARNTHLIVYDIPLACAVLFGITEKGHVKSPSELKTLNVPVAQLYTELRADKDPVAEFQRLREKLERENRKVDDEKIAGSEGAVWYVKPKTGGMVLFKCKPESVEEIHWSAGINKAAVEMTCWNLLETADELIYEDLVPLLLEEYDQDEIDAFRDHICDCIAKVNEDLAFRKTVLDAYRDLGLDIAEDKGVVMRALSQSFAKKDMKKVYTLIANYG